MMRGGTLGSGCFRVASVSVALVALAAAGNAGAATIDVTTRADQFGTEPQRCALREAVQSANTNTEFGGCTRSGAGVDDVITPRGGKTYTLSLPGSEDINASGDLDVIGALTVAVSGDGTATIDGGDLDRVLEVRPNSELVGSRLVVTEGALPTTESGAGIYNQGKLVLRRSRVTENTTAAGGGGGGGGGIYAAGSMTRLDRVTVSNNTVGGSSGYGGGIADTAGTFTVRRSTIAGNSAVGGGGLYLNTNSAASVLASTINGNAAESEQFSGGGVYIYDGSAPFAPMRLTNVTISANRADGSGGGIRGQGSPDIKLNAVTITGNIADFDGDSAGFVSGSGGGLEGTVGFKNSIVADNFATNAGSEDCYQALNLGHNLVGLGGGCDNPDVGTDDPRLGPLADNGGPTETHALKRGSPAIGKAGKSAPARDQRGVKRDAHPDAGAYERR